MRFSQPWAWRAGLALILASMHLAVAAEPANSAQEVPSPANLNTAVDDPRQVLALVETELARERAQVDALITRDRERLAALTTGSTAETITATQLETARLDLAALESRRGGLQTRLRARRGALERLEERERDLERELADPDLGEEARALVQAERAELQEVGPRLERIIDNLQALNQGFERRVVLARQTMVVLQARFALPDIDEVRSVRGPEADVIRQRIDRALVRSSRLRQQAAVRDAQARAEPAPEQQEAADTERRLLELRALAAEEEADLLQLRLARLQARQWLRSLGVLADSTATPARVIERALKNLDQLETVLAEQQRQVAAKPQQVSELLAIERQRRALQSAADSDGLRRAETALADLRTLADEDLADIASRREEVAERRTRYRDILTRSAGAELLERNALPADWASWQPVLATMATLPARVGHAFVEAASGFAVSLGQADAGLQVMLLLMGAGLLTLLVRRRGLREVDADASDASTAILGGPLQLLQRHAGAMLLPVLVLVAGLLIGTPPRDLTLLLTPLLIYPAVRIALDFANTFLDHYTPELSAARTRLLLLETRWVIVLTAVLAAMLAAAFTIALSPVIIDLIQRAAMLCLLLLAIPLLHLRALLLEGVSGEVTSLGLRYGTLLLPALLSLCALMGLVGYVNLALATAERLAWLALFAVAAHYIHQALCGLTSVLTRSMARRDADAAQFWRAYLLDPSRRVVFLLLVIVGGRLLFDIYGWSAQTPIVRIVPEMLSAVVFTVGETPIYVKTLLLGLLVIAAAVWGGGWSRQVTYRWVYTGVADSGLRNSLATFTQYLVVIVGVVAALKIIGLDLTALTVFAGALGVGIGFGMQQIVVNFISGILLLVERPLATSDLVNVDKYEGQVTRIGIRSLTVKTWDNQEVIIPNSAVITQPFINWTRADDVMRTVLMIGISYDDDPRRAVDIIKSIIAAHPAVLDTPASKVLLWEFADSALMIRVQLHSRINGPVGRVDLRSQLLFSIWEAFAEAGITIPYPQRDVHLRGALPALSSEPARPPVRDAGDE